MDLDRGTCGAMLVITGAAVAALASIVYQLQDPFAALLPVLVGGLLIAHGLRVFQKLDQHSSDGPLSK